MVSPRRRRRELEGEEIARESKIRRTRNCYGEVRRKRERTVFERGWVLTAIGVAVCKNFAVLSFPRNRGREKQEWDGYRKGRGACLEIEVKTGPCTLFGTKK